MSRNCAKTSPYRSASRAGCCVFSMLCPPAASLSCVSSGTGLCSSAVLFLSGIAPGSCFPAMPSLSGISSLAAAPSCMLPAASAPSCILPAASVPQPANKNAADKNTAVTICILCKLFMDVPPKSDLYSATGFIIPECPCK